MTRLRSIGVGICALLPVLLAGCSDGGTATPSVAPASGIVTYQGKPVTGATVNFIKEGASRSGVGVTNAEGRFQISTFANNDGALIGDNVVTIVKKTASATAAAPTSATSSPEDMAKNMQGQFESSADQANAKADELPVKYANPEVSGLKAIVSADSKKNDYKFELVD